MKWPKDLSEVAIWNSDDVCDRCFHYWNQSDLSQEQDHCRPMYDTNDQYREFTNKQRGELGQLVSSGTLCPYFEPLTAANFEQAARHWGQIVQRMMKELMESKKET